MAWPEYGPFREMLAQYLATYGEEGRKRLADQLNDRHFSEVLLMSLIRGNRIRVAGSKQNSPPKDLERLSQAHVAIFGGLPSAFANTKDDDHALTWMAESRELEEAKRRNDPTAPEPASAQELANRAHKHFAAHPMDSDGEFRHTRPHMSSPDNLRKKFPAFWEERKKRQATCEYDLEIEVLRRAALDEIELILRLFGVEFRRSGQAAAYVRFDLRCDKSWAFQRWKLTLYGEVLNLSNHDNRIYTYTTGVNPTTLQTTIQTEQELPVTPTAGLAFEF